MAWLLSTVQNGGKDVRILASLERNFTRKTYTLQAETSVSSTFFKLWQNICVFFFWNDLLLEYIETLVWLVSSCLHVAHSACEVEQRMKTTGDESVSPVTILPPPGIPLGFDFFPPYLVGYSPPPAKKKGTIPCPRTPIYFNYVCMWNKTGGNIGRYAQKKRIFNRNEYFQYKIKAIAKNQTFFKAN